jgi:glycosyltransferase involved in cell wall biosynthesis
MTAKKNIVLFWFMNDWGKYGRAYEEIALALSKHPNTGLVTCVLPPVKAHDQQFMAAIHRHTKNLMVITPFWQSINKSGIGYRLRTWFNQKYPPLTLIRLYLYFKGYSKDNTVLWIYPPHQFIPELINNIPHKTLVTQIVDNNSFRTDASYKIAFSKLQYDELSQSANLVITSSAVNYSIFSKLNNNCLFIENGVSERFISTPSDFPFKKNNTQPRLGYLGFISQRTDIELIRHVALMRPNCLLLIAGPDEGIVEPSGITELPNVKYIGPVPHIQAPSFLRNLDICLIPHKDNEYSRSMSPLKLFQYLASGRPIVSTRVAGTERWGDLVMLSESYDTFVRNIDMTFETDNLEKSAMRIEAVKAENWNNRVDHMVNKLMELD